MGLTNLDKETLYLKTVNIKNLAACAKIANFDDIITVCNELLGLLDQLQDFEKGLKCLKLVKEFHNFAHNI